MPVSEYKVKWIHGESHTTVRYMFYEPLILRYPNPQHINITSLRVYPLTKKDIEITTVDVPKGLYETLCAARLFL